MNGTSDRDAVKSSKNARLRPLPPEGGHLFVRRELSAFGLLETFQDARHVVVGNDEHFVFTVRNESFDRLDHACILTCSATCESPLLFRWLALGLLGLHILVGVLPQDEAARYGETGNQNKVEALAILVRPG